MTWPAGTVRMRCTHGKPLAGNLVIPPLSVSLSLLAADKAA
jgi:hypothetical protein